MPADSPATASPVAALIEDLASYSPPTSAPKNLRESVRMSAEARARTCYDHLAGHLGVALTDAILDRGLVAADDGGLAVTEVGVAWLAEPGIDLSTLKGSRPMVRRCLDWTERRTHLAGAVGAALCGQALDQRWVERIGSGRALTVTPGGRRAFGELLGTDLSIATDHL